MAISSTFVSGVLEFVDAAGLDGEDRHRSPKGGGKGRETLNAASCPRHKEQAWARTPRLQLDDSRVRRPR